MARKIAVTAATKETFINAFWELYRNTNIDKITVGELTRKAGYNRSTFYEYFTDIYDILEQAENDTLAEIKTALEANFKDGIPDNISDYSARCAKIFRLFEDKLFVLLGPHGDPKFNFKIKETLLEVTSEMLPFARELNKKDYVVTFAFSALVGLMTYWYENGQNMSDNEFVLLVQTLIATGVTGFAKFNFFDNNSDKVNDSQYTQRQNDCESLTRR